MSNEHDQLREHPRPSVRSQVAITLKLVAGAGAITAVLWFLDQVVLG